jgi:hypothetical protein
MRGILPFDRMIRASNTHSRNRLRPSLEVPPINLTIQAVNALLINRWQT